MRVAQVMAGAAAGGAELFFERLCVALRDAGESVLPVIRGDAARAARLAGGGLAPEQLPFGGMLDLMTRPALRRRLRRFNPAVVVAWMNRAARLTPAGPWVLVGRLGGFYDLRYYRRCDHLVANTRGLAAWIAGQGWPAGRVHYLPNFSADMAGRAAADRSALGVPAGARIVLALGRLHRNKAFDVLVLAMGELEGVHLVIAGDGPERAALENLVRREGLQGRVHLAGWREDSGALLAACDVLVCPSRHEPLGNVVIEAWSAGRPVVACAAQGPAELITPGRDGVLVPPEDPGRLAAAIGGVLADPVAAGAMARAGRARFAAEFAEEPVVTRWRSFLAAVERR